MPISKKLILFIVLAFSLHSISNAQDFEEGRRSLGIEIAPGNLSKLSDRVDHISDSDPFSIELHYRHHLTDTLGDQWVKRMKYPSMGVLFSLSDFNNPQQLGYALHLATYVGIPIRKFKRSKLEFRIGAGMTYGTKKFDLNDNRQNNLYSTNFSGLGYLRLMYMREISKNIQLAAGGGLIHFSNGSFQLPNLGVNIFSGNIGLFYFLKEQEKPKKKERSFIPEADGRKYFLNITAGIGFKETLPVNGKKYGVYTMIVGVERKTQSISSWLLSLDFNRNTSLKSELNFFYPNQTFENDYRVAIMPGYALRAGRLYALGQLGVYVYSPIEAPRPYYQKLGLRYQLLEKIYFGLNMKAHGGVADFVEYVITYQI